MKKGMNRFRATLARKISLMKLAVEILKADREAGLHGGEDGQLGEVIQCLEEQLERMELVNKSAQSWR